MIVKCHSSQKKTGLFIAGNASRTTSQLQEQAEGADSEDPVAAMVVTTEALDLVDETADHAKCLMQNAETVEMIVRYHSSQKKTDLFIAGNASRTTDKVKNRFE